MILRLGDLGGQCCWGGSLFCWGVGGESGDSHTPCRVVVSDSVSIAHIRLASVVSPVNEGGRSNCREAGVGFPAAAGRVMRVVEYSQSGS